MTLTVALEKASAMLDVDSSASAKAITASQDRADRARAISLMPEIAIELRPGAKITSTATETRIGTKGSLAITAGGEWFDHEAGVGGSDPIPLVLHLKQCEWATAQAFVKDFLRRHPGHGRYISANPNKVDAVRQRIAAFAAAALRDATPITGTPAQTYLESRGLPGPYPPGLGYLPDARLAEDALIATLVAPGADGALRAVGCQAGYLDARGRKSVIPPPRKVFFGDDGPDEHAGAHFRIEGTPSSSSSSSNDPPDAPATFVVEGVEDALATHAAFPHSTIIAALGVGNIAKLPPIAGKVIVICDGDPEDSVARKALMHGVDHLLLGGAKVVLVTPTPDGMDPNGILQDGGDGALRDLVEQAKPQSLSLDGDVERLAKLDRAGYDRERAQAAKAHGVRVSTLDGMVDQQHHSDALATDDDDGMLFPDDPWPDPIGDIAAVLDVAVTEITRYVHAASADDYFIISIWALHTHFVRHKHITLQVSPRLSCEAPAPACGKTVALETTSCLSARMLLTSSLSSSAFFRAIDAWAPTLFIDEAHELFRAKGTEELLAILRSSHRRSTAHVLRTDETANRGRGKFKPHRYSTWCALSYTSIGKLRDTMMQSRAISVVLPRAMPGEVKAHLRDGKSPVLDECRRKLARWAEDQDQLPEISLSPELANRDGDNWRPIIELAHLVGGEWPERITKAALAKVGSDATVRGSGVMIALLADIRKVIGGRDRITTKELVQGLLGLEEDASRDWSITNRGRPLDHYWLRDTLDGVLDPPGTQRWKLRDKVVRGYTNHQLRDAFGRYLPSVASETPSSSDPGKPSGPSGASVTEVKNGSNDSDLSGDGCLSADPSPHASPHQKTDKPQDVVDISERVTDAVTDHARASATKNPKPSQGPAGQVTHGPDGTDGLRGSGKTHADGRHQSARKPNGRAKHIRAVVVPRRPLDGAVELNIDELMAADEPIEIDADGGCSL